MQQAIGSVGPSTPATQRAARIHQAIDALEAKLADVIRTPHTLTNAGVSDSSGSQFFDELDGAANRLEDITARLVL